jgi:hypothetical protein
MIWYTPCTGIWQTVFLESTPSEHVSKLDLSAGMDGKGTYRSLLHTGSCHADYLQ